LELILLTLEMLLLLENDDTEETELREEAEDIEDTLEE
jgi:hypothetical protein